MTCSARGRTGLTVKRRVGTLPSCPIFTANSMQSKSLASSPVVHTQHSTVHLPLTPHAAPWNTWVFRGNITVEHCSLFKCTLPTCNTPLVCWASLLAKRVHLSERFQSLFWSFNYPLKSTHLVLKKDLERSHDIYNGDMEIYTTILGLSQALENYLLLQPPLPLPNLF